jgi:hypothetical protein
MEIIRVNNLAEGRQKLASLKTPLLIVNSSSSIRVYGIFAIIYILENLKKEFNIVEDFMIDCDDDLASFVTLLKLKLEDKDFKSYKAIKDNYEKFCNKV